MKKRKLHSLRIPIAVILALLIIASIFLIRKNTSHAPQSVDIVLSPHFDDAVLSLGGMLAHNDSEKVVATFFHEAGDQATSTSWDMNSGFKDSKSATAARVIENQNALANFNATIKNFYYEDSQYGRTEDDGTLEVEISKDIQSLIASYPGREINVYGPAIFTSDIAHPDHALLHRAFIQVSQDYPNSNVHFYIYEDYPYVERFMGSSVISLQKYIEKESDVFLDKKIISLTSRDVSKKIKALGYYASQLQAFTALKKDILKDDETFTTNRCGKDPAVPCEVVYQILK